MKTPQNEGLDLRVVVPGPAVPQGSQRAFVRGNKAIITSANPKLKDWRTMAVTLLQEARGDRPPWEGPVYVCIEETRLRPRSVKRDHPTVKPDLDKVIRACLDALTVAGVIRDDAQVIDIEATKQYADEALTEIFVMSVDDD